MDGFIDVLKVWLPLAIGLCSFVGVCITIFLLGWRIPSRADMDRRHDRLDKRIDGEISKLTNALNQGLADKIDTNSQALNDKIDANSQTLNDKIDTTSQALNDKIDANSQAIHVDSRKLTEQINNVANDLCAEIRERISGTSENA